MTVPANNLYQQEIDNPEESLIDIRKLFFNYLMHWKWFVISFAMLAASGYVYVSTLTPQYRISASILVKDNKKGDNFSMLEELEMFNNVKLVENEIEILRSFTLLGEVIDELNLQVRYATESRWRKNAVYGNLPVKIEIIAPTNELFSRPFNLRFEGDHIIFDEKTYPCDALITESFGILRITTIPNDSLPTVWDKKKPLIVTFARKESLMESIHSSLQVSLVKNTAIINLSILSAIPQRGKDILNQLVIVYNKAAIADKNNMAGLTLNFIDERLKFVGEDLRRAEQNVEEYKIQQGITNISAESSLFLQNIQNNDAELSKVKIQLSVLSQIEQYVLSNASSVAPATLGLSDPTLISLISSLTDAEAERTKMLSTTQPANIRVRALDDQITTLKGKLIDNIHVLRRSLEATQQNLKVESLRMESLKNSIPQKERKLVDITRQQEIINQIYIYLLSKREEIAISHAATVADSRIVNAARSTSSPVQPNKKLIFMLFGFFGLLLPAGVLWLIDCFKITLSSKEELEKTLKAPLTGEISFVEQANRLVILQKNKSRQAEQLRTLRTNIEYMRAGGGVKVILITSGISQEGKSFLTANLGAAFAALGKKTVMLGFDLRKPGLDVILGIDNHKGLSDYLAGQVTLEKIIYCTSFYNNLHIITSGYTAPNPQELLSGNKLSQLFDQLKEQYDYIIIDTSPIGLMSDAMILERFADVTLYVVRQNYTPKDRIKCINELYHTKRLNNLGVVVNGIDEEKWYGYGYGMNKYYAKYYESGG